MILKLQKLKPRIIEILKKNGVVKAGIFGSYARGDQSAKSDIDILVKLKKGKGYFDLIRLEKELRLSVKKEVDIITYNSINHLLKKKILEEEVRIL